MFLRSDNAVLLTLLQFVYIALGSINNVLSPKPKRSDSKYQRTNMELVTMSVVAFLNCFAISGIVYSIDCV